MLDIEILLQAVDPANPAGPDLAYSEVAELDRLAAGSPGAIDPATGLTQGFAPPDWRTVSRAAQRLLARSKDLRAAVWLVRAELETRGLPGLADGLEVLAALLTRYWETLHPRIDAGDAFVPVERCNILLNLSPQDEFQGSNSAPTLLRALRGTIVADSREAGRLTVRDLEIALGRLPAAPGATPPPAVALLAAGVRRDDNVAVASRAGGVARSLSAIRSITALVRDRCQESPDFEPLTSTLTRLAEFFASAGDLSCAVGRTSAADRDHETGRADPCVSGEAALATRADAVAQLQAVSEFLRQCEPSSPAPLFVDRAIRLLRMDFASIVNDLVPESRARIEMLGGVSLGRPQSD